MIIKVEIFFFSELQWRGQFTSEYNPDSGSLYSPHVSDSKPGAQVNTHVYIQKVGVAWLWIC